MSSLCISITQTAYSLKSVAAKLSIVALPKTTIAPGAIETDFLGGSVRDVPAYNDTFASMTALGRVGVPEDIGPAVANLLGPDNRWVNAQRIEVSGGQNI